MIKQLKGTYIIVDRDNNAQVKTLRYGRKDCIDSFIGEATLTWKEAKKYGWRCAKVFVDFCEF